ncbi:TPA: DUF2110 family protein [Candidatus Bathyarchaeota archaeon]|nr:DUF2110 family protein [Candidatus Bathyarchaeota archaeon]
MELLISERVPPERKEKTLRYFSSLISRAAEGLLVEVKGISEEGGFIKMAIEGEDAEALASFVKEKFGLAPMDLSSVEIGEILKSFISGEKSEGGIEVELGAARLGRIKAFLPLSSLRAHLTRGESVSVEEIRRRYCLVEGFPLEVRVARLEGGKIVAELSDKQFFIFKEWRSLPFERLIVAGALMEEVKEGVEAANLEEIIITIEPLSLLVHSLICKLGFASGPLASKLGEKLAGARVLAFSPTEVKVNR